MTTPVPRPQVGRVVTLAEADYRYGLGPLVVRVTRVLRQMAFDGEPWWEVDAVARMPNAHGPGVERLLYIRAAALKAQRGEQSPPRTQSTD